MDPDPVMGEHRVDVRVFVVLAMTGGHPAAVLLASVKTSITTMNRSYPSLFGCQYASGSIGLA